MRDHLNLGGILLGLVVGGALALYMALVYIVGRFGYPLSTLSTGAFIFSDKDAA